MIVTSSAQVDKVIAKLHAAERVVVDTETSGLEPWKDDRQCGIGFAFPDKSGYYLPFRHPDSNLKMDVLPELFEALSKVPTLVGYNLKFDLAVMSRDGYIVQPDQALEDLIVAARLCEADKNGSLKLRDQLVKFFGAASAAYDDEFKAYLKTNKWSKSFHLAPAGVVGQYCIGDVIRTEELRERLLERIEETEQTRVWEQEVALTSVLWDMERTGIRVDHQYAKIKVPQMSNKVSAIREKLYTIAGGEFNPNSSKQLRSVMKALKLKSPKKSPKTQEYSWDKEVLSATDHPIASTLLELRAIEKLLGTYFDPALNSWGAVVHTNFKSQGAITGRMSATNPALQTIAKKTQDLASGAVDLELLKASLGKIVAPVDDDVNAESNASARRLFIPRKGKVLILADYSQMEMRVFADYCGDKAMFKLLEDPTFDFHDHVATQVWKVTSDHELWKFYRFLAKAINFGLIFGIGVRKLAAQIQATLDETKQFKEEYFGQFPSAQVFIQMVSKTVEARGWIRNRFNRRYYIDRDRAYIGVNYLVQGTSADIVKNRMIALARWIFEMGLKTRILIQVHDEVILESPEDEVKLVTMNVKRILEERQINTFLPVEVSIARESWATKETLVELPDLRLVTRSEYDILQEAA